MEKEKQATKLLSLINNGMYLIFFGVCRIELGSLCITLYTENTNACGLIVYIFSA